MFYVYCLKSKKRKGYHYYGFTQDVNGRLVRHNKGYVTSTKPYRPLELIGYIGYDTKEEALEKEKKLKTSLNARKVFIGKVESTN